jgi:thioredoxin-dependent peroxiredoxin
MLRVGDRAPDFRAETTAGNPVRLSELHGRYVVIYFFPRAFTSGCTLQTQRFRDNYPEIRALGAEVIGVSTDGFDKQCRFAKAEGVSFPLIGDDSQTISRAYGALRSILGFDRRITFVIDGEGVVRAVFHHEFQILKHLDDVLGFLRDASRAARNKNST